MSQDLRTKLVFPLNLGRKLTWCEGQFHFPANFRRSRFLANINFLAKFTGQTNGALACEQVLQSQFSEFGVE